MSHRCRSSRRLYRPFKTLAHRAKSKQPEADHPNGMTSQVESALSNRRPLTVLDHIDLFEEARLEGEGITDVEALAHGEIVDLLVATRTPAGRLVDWVDQALLIIHIEQPSTAGGVDGRLGELRKLGLRTATDLVNASINTTVGPPTGTTSQGGELAATFGSEFKLALIVDSIKAEPNYVFVDWWRKSPLGKPTDDVKLVLGADGCLHDRPPMDQGGRCGSVLGDNDSPSGNGHRDEAPTSSRSPRRPRRPIPTDSSTRSDRLSKAAPSLLVAPPSGRPLSTTVVRTVADVCFAGMASAWSVALPHGAHRCVGRRTANAVSRRRAASARLPSQPPRTPRQNVAG